MTMSVKNERMFKITIMVSMGLHYSSEHFSDIAENSDIFLSLYCMLQHCDTHLWPESESKMNRFSPWFAFRFELSQPENTFSDIFSIASSNYYWAETLEMNKHFCLIWLKAWILRNLYYVFQAKQRKLRFVYWDYFFHRCLSILIHGSIAIW